MRYVYVYMHSLWNMWNVKNTYSTYIHLYTHIYICACMSNI